MLISKWLQEYSDAQYLEKGASVPCGDCRGCCTSGYFIHIQPHEKATLASIPKKLLFPAPGLPKGNVLLGYRENGHCPMFKNNACSIYENRPQTCRNYDCRIFAATGIKIEKDKPLIAAQIKGWKFDARSKDEGLLLKAVQASAKNYKRRAKAQQGYKGPTNATQLAMEALNSFIRQHPPDFLN